ncbi:MAG: hypothetical protein WDO73_01970 [Ignavibacteriota bacterium]
MPGVSTKVLMYTRTSAELSTRTPLSQRTKTLPATIAPREDLEEEAVLRALDPVVHDHAVAVAHVIPDAIRIGLVDNQVVAGK